MIFQNKYQRAEAKKNVTKEKQSLHTLSSVLYTNHPSSLRKTILAQLQSSEHFIF